VGTRRLVTSCTEIRGEKDGGFGVRSGLRDQRYRSLRLFISFLAETGGARDVVDIQGESYGIRRAIKPA
jgi:hypothetical protein